MPGAMEAFEKGFEIVDAVEACAEVARGEALPVDARSDEEWIRGRVIGAIHLPRGEIGWRGKLLDEGSRLIVIAEDIERSADATIRLTRRGFDGVAVDGGTQYWTSSAFNVPGTAEIDPYTGLGLK